MKYQKYNSISDRKEWKSITSKIPTDEINEIWEKQYPLKVCEIKFLATLLEYNQSNIGEKFSYYKSLSPNIQKGREYYHDNNHEYFLITKYGYFYIDYVNKDRMKAVEFNGDVFHGNPEMFLKDDRPNPYDKSKTAEDIWKYDEIKMKAIREHGFDALIIWEKDYRENKEREIKKINEFVYG